MAQAKCLAMVLADLARGGIGKMRVHLANEFARRGIRVDLLLARTESPYLELVGPGVRVVDVRTSHALFGAPRIARYLRRERPDVVLTQRSRVNAMVLRARALAGVAVPVYSTFNTNQTAQLASLTPRKARSQLAQMRRFYPRNDGLIAISQGVADDAAKLLGLERARLRIIFNPVVTPGLSEQAAQTPEHPWFHDGGPAVILGVGRLEPQKDFPTLLDAFARLRAQGADYRLLILGEGKLRAELQAQIDRLGLQAQVALPGFAVNPYPYMAQARLLVMSSAWEGLGNVLVEALALGTPVVSTDCPDGPAEILEGGRYGRLVPVGDAGALATAMAATLAAPLPAAELKAAAQRFTLPTIASAYLDALGLA
ncbi:glycosyltransferase [Plasticicumulans acidivorans]|uniref:Glycosyltransferase involved in cell wall biosynthesis n=1 Tax=Plasticicumulans acidivorans TaxID=886464 RepID=A0A317MWQ7_9GAMM|nr:glycosyltransferase [Plasticicumulans acidivorans]PWV62523.1 glycosyltransferase involved in cell wall biosynthesis [Plasticicumulans acidivorans]